MLIYFCLIIYILLLSRIVPRFTKKERVNEVIALLGILAIYLLFSLKADTVGIDISGYKAEYLLSRKKNWNDFEYVYFENGYILLEKIFSKINLSFQIFTAFIYAIICSAWYQLIKKTSTNSTLSLLIFVCYQFFVFNMSGLRQALATAICIFSYLFITKRNAKDTVISVVLVLIAQTFHRSAILFIVAIILYHLCSKTRHRFNLLVHIFLVIFSFFARSYVRPLVEKYFGEEFQTVSVSLGGSFIFLVGIMFFMLLTLYEFTSKNKGNTHGDVYVPLDTFYLDIMFVIIDSQILFSGDTLLRASMYYSLFLVPAIPYTISRCNQESRAIANLLITIFLIFVFYCYTLAPNQFNICPYEFFWN